MSMHARRHLRDIIARLQAATSCCAVKMREIGYIRVNSDIAV